MKIIDIINFFNIFSPTSLSADWDNDGEVIVKSKEKEVKKILITLDVTSFAVDKALKYGADLIISHHPLIFKPISKLDDSSYSKNIYKLIENNISVISYHTRLDSAELGINYYILNLLGLNNITPFGLNEYDKTGRVGEFTSETTVELLAQKLKILLECRKIIFTRSNKIIKKVAIVSGGGSDYISDAKRIGADVFVSGDFHHHHYVNAVEEDFPIICVDHYHCENVFVDLIFDVISKKFPTLSLIKNKGISPVDII